MPAARATFWCPPKNEPGLFYIHRTTPVREREWTDAQPAFESKRPASGETFRFNPTARASLADYTA